MKVSKETMCELMDLATQATKEHGLKLEISYESQCQSVKVEIKSELGEFVAAEYSDDYQTPKQFYKGIREVIDSHIKDCEWERDMYLDELDF